MVRRLEFRPLLYETPNRLSAWQRVQQQGLIILLGFPDLYYRSVFNRLDRALNRLTIETRVGRHDRTGIAMMNAHRPAAYSNLGNALLDEEVEAHGRQRPTHRFGRSRGPGQARRGSCSICLD